ncbi:MAG: M23 family metallopeptidase [Clostridia bacterium]|nr:M23 family metallopeptidase [Clostridia bacterium]
MMKRQVKHKPTRSSTIGKHFFLQVAVCGLILVLVLAVQKTAWSETVELQIQRLFGYEIDFEALGSMVKQYWLENQELPKEPITEPVVNEPIQDIEEPIVPEKWTLLNTGRITSRYGEREMDGVTGFHSGIDIAGNYGDWVYAIGDGEVFECGVDEGYGNYIKIRHSDKGITTLYGHLQSIRVNEGQRVTRGDLIGTVGSTGRSSGPHLHLEVRDLQNHTLDPEPYIAY